MANLKKNFSEQSLKNVFCSFFKNLASASFRVEFNMCTCVISGLLLIVPQIPQRDTVKLDFLDTSIKPSIVCRYLSAFFLNTKLCDKTVMSA